MKWRQNAIHEAVNYHAKHLRDVHKTAQSMTFSLKEKCDDCFQGLASFPSPPPIPRHKKVEWPGTASEWGAQVVMVTVSLLVYYDYY